MSTYDLILNRRSIRRFRQESIPLSSLAKMVNAARVAPSAANLQPLQYVIVNDPEQVERVFSTLQWAGYIKPQGDPTQGERPVAYIVIVTNSHVKPAGYNQDVGAAIENMILTALEEGIGSCWIESLDRTILREIIELPKQMVINAVLTLGYPNEAPVLAELSTPDSSIKYWKDEQGQLHVPKRSLGTIMHCNKFPQACPLAESNEGWKVLMETSLEEEAYLVHGLLENNGIPCFIENLKFHEMPVNFGPMSKLRLLVPENQLQEGKDLIDLIQKEGGLNAQEQESNET